MSVRFSNLTWLFLVGAVLLLVLGGLSIWFGDGDSPARPGPAMPDTANRGTAAQPAGATGSPLPALGTSPAPPFDPDSEPLDWELEKTDILGADIEDEEMIKRLLVLMPRLQDTNLVNAAEVLVETVMDENYSLIIPMLTNPTTTPEVMDVLMSDLVNRPDPMHIPLLLAIAKDQNHPRREDALEYLGNYVDEDYGTDWNRWQQAIDKYLKETADPGADDAL